MHGSEHSASREKYLNVTTLACYTRQSAYKRLACSTILESYSTPVYLKMVLQNRVFFYTILGEACTSMASYGHHLDFCIQFLIIYLWQNGDKVMYAPSGLYFSYNS